MPCVPLKSSQPVLIRHPRGVAEVFDQLERVADRKDFRAFDVLDLVGERFHVAVKADAIAAGVLGCIFPLDDLHAERGQAFIDRGATPFHLVVDADPFAHIFEFSDLETHHVFIAFGQSVHRIACRIGPSMLE